MNAQNDRPDPDLSDAAPIPDAADEAAPQPAVTDASGPDAPVTDAPDDAVVDAAAPDAPRPLPADSFTLSPIAPTVDDDDAWLRGDPSDDDGSDVDNALAAVASLTVVSDREADAAPQPPPEPVKSARRGRASFAAPPLTTPKRGNLASIGIGLALIAAGAAWTFITTTGGALDPGVIALGAVGLVVLALLLAWLSSGRWARGLLFFAITLAGLVGLVTVTLTTPGLELAIAWPLLLLAPGIACLITAVIGRPAAPRLLLPGAVLIAAAAVGVAFNAGLIPIDLSGITALVPR